MIDIFKIASYLHLKKKCFYVAGSSDLRNPV